MQKGRERGGKGAREDGSERGWEEGLIIIIIIIIIIINNNSSINNNNNVF